MRSPGGRLLGKLAFLALGVALLFWLSHRLPLVETITQVQEAVLATGWWGWLLYPLLFALVNLLLLPGTVLAVGAGWFFGLWWGAALMLGGNMIGAAAAFLIGRSVAGAWLERRLGGYPRWFALKAAIRREGWKIIFLTQVLPLFPSSLLNYLYGLSSIRFWPCMGWISIGQAPALFLYAYMGQMARLGLEEGWRGSGWWLAGLAGTLLGFFTLGRIALRLLAACGDDAFDARSFDSGGKSVSVPKNR